MKKLLFLFAVILCVDSAVAQDKKPASKSKSTSTRKAKPALVIDFISKGAGIDRESFTKIETFIKDHPKKPVYEVKQKGREGETTLTLGLYEFSKEEKAAFIDEIKKMIVKHDLVFINGSKVKPNPKVTTQTDPLPDNVYRIVISFISKGGGPDNKTQEKIVEYIEKHPKKPLVDVRRWGREGEVDYCLHLNELSPEEQASFIKDINKLIPDKEMVFTQENVKYVKKGR